MFSGIEIGCKTQGLVWLSIAHYTTDSYNMFVTYLTYVQVYLPRQAENLWGILLGLNQRLHYKAKIAQ
jgi:hypothetical protein